VAAGAASAGRRLAGELASPSPWAPTGTGAREDLHLSGLPGELAGELAKLADAITRPQP